MCCSRLVIGDQFLIRSAFTWGSRYLSNHFCYYCYLVLLWYIKKTKEEKQSQFVNEITAKEGDSEQNNNKIKARRHHITSMHSQNFWKLWWGCSFMPLLNWIASTGWLWLTPPSPRKQHTQQKQKPYPKNMIIILFLCLLHATFEEQSRNYGFACVTFTILLFHTK